MSADELKRLEKEFEAKRKKLLEMQEQAKMETVQEAKMQMMPPPSPAGAAAPMARMALAKPVSSAMPLTLSASSSMSSAAPPGSPSLGMKMKKSASASRARGGRSAEKDMRASSLSGLTDGAAGDDSDLEDAENESGGGGGSGGGGANAFAGADIAMRSNFCPLAAFKPSVVTDKDGRALIEVTLPDSLSSYRVWVVAATRDQFGFAESSVVVQIPVMLRPSPPRFLNFGDTAHVSCVLNNQTDKKLDVAVGLRASNLELSQSVVSYRVTLEPGLRGYVTFPIKTMVSLAFFELSCFCAASHQVMRCALCEQMSGVARMQFFLACASEAFSDAAEIEVPVYTPATSEAFATYGDVDGNAVIAQTIKVS